MSLRIALDYALGTVPHGYHVSYTICGMPASKYFENICAEAEEP